MIKNKIFISLVLIVILSLCGCSVNETKKNDQYTTNEVTKGIGGDRGSIHLTEMTSTGEITYDCFSNNKKFLNRCGDEGEDIFPFVYKDKYGYADANGNVVIKENYVLPNIFTNGKAIVCSDSGIKSKQPIFKVLDKNSELLSISSGINISDSLIKAKFENGKAIYTSMLEPNTYEINVINADMSINPIKIEGSSNGFIKVKRLYTDSFDGFLTGLYRNGKYVEIINDISGNLIWSQEYAKTNYNTPGIGEAASAFWNAIGQGYPLSTSGGLTAYDSIFVKNGCVNIPNADYKWGLLNLTNGKMEINYEYDFVGAYDSGVCVVCNYDKWGAVNLKGETVIPFDFKFIGEFTNNRAFAITNDGKSVLINNSGDILSIYDVKLNINRIYVTSFSEKTGLAVLFENGYGTYEKSFHIITDKGTVLKSIGSCKELFISDQHVFIDGKMYKIEYMALDKQ
ncbi:MAG: WG repeat-containing protein [Clostridia bacterium]|nr:WG repeat-containing protein [Clostridia bacterium]